MVGSISQFSTVPSTSSTSSSSSTTNPALNPTATQALTSVPGASVLGGGTQVTTTGAALLGTGGSTASLLSEFTGSGDAASSIFGTLSSTNSELLNQVEATFNKRLQDDLDAINNEATDQQNGLNIQSNRWIQVKAGINNAQIYVQNGQDAATKVANTLLDMRTSIANTDQPGQDPSFWQDQFDTQVNSINNLADSASQQTNLVGAVNPYDYTPNQIQYRNDTGVGVTTLNGTNIGNDFRIVGNDGTVWAADVDTDSITAYSNADNVGGQAESFTTSDGTTLEKSTSTRNGLTLVSYDPNTQDITVNVSIDPTDPPITVTGKLEQSGIGVMGSWFYNNFATTADRNRAFSDINSAEVNLTSAQATLTAAGSQVQADNQRVTAQLNQIGNAITDSQTQQQSDVQAAEIKAAQQYQMMQANLQNLESVQSNYLAAFSGFVDDPFAQASLSTIA